MISYFPEKNSCGYKIGAVRSAGTSTLDIPAKLSGHSLHTWMSFISADEKDVATSLYTGEVMIP
jgi:hypothetical protein